jgi:hypothetical protein
MLMIAPGAVRTDRAEGSADRSWRTVRGQHGGDRKMAPGRIPSGRGILLKLLALVMAAAIWFPCLHFLFRPTPGSFRSEKGIAPRAQMLAARHLAIWTDPQLRRKELLAMQARNPEWDFMSRTFFVLALTNMALRDPALKRQACEIADVILEDTLKHERQRGLYHFSLGYARNPGLWVMKPPRSQFVDGEIALMLAARRWLEEKAEYRPLLAERVDIMVRRMRRSPIRCAESYPNECWLFCNTVSLAAIRMADALDGTDHSEFLAEWVQRARGRLVETRTGLLISAFTPHGVPAACGYGPEGSSIWMACHMLQIVDHAFARDQYRRARRELARSFMGFGYSREWPESCPGTMDVDSGPVVPYLGASASASGLAIMAAAAFGDRPFFSKLLTSVNMAAFPMEADGQIRYQASNPVGDAVLLYAMVLGPLWDEVEEQGRRTRKQATGK